MGGKLQATSGKLVAKMQERGGRNYKRERGRNYKREGLLLRQK